MIGMLWSRLIPAFTGPCHSRADRSSFHYQLQPWTCVQLPYQFSMVSASFSHSRHIIGKFGRWLNVERHVVEPTHTRIHGAVP